MKKLFFLLALLILSCSGGDEKPRNLIPAERMPALISDMLIFKEAYHQQSKSFDKAGIRVEASVLAMHGVDSAQFYESMAYYARHPEELEKIYAEVEKKIKHRLDSLDKVTKVKQVKKGKKSKKKQPVAPPFGNMKPK